jgi:hypothetical protein
MVTKMANITTSKYEELFIKLHEVIAKRKENPIRLKVPLNTIDKGTILQLGEYFRKHAFNFQTYLEGENTFVIAVEY